MPVLVDIVVVFFAVLDACGGQPCVTQAMDCREILLLFNNTVVVGMPWQGRSSRPARQHAPLCAIFAAALLLCWLRLSRPRAYWRAYDGVVRQGVTGGPQSSEFNQPFVFTMDLSGVAKHRVARKRIQSGRVRRLTRGNHHRTQCAHVHLRIKQGSPDGFAASPAGCHVDPTTRLPVC